MNAESLHRLIRGSEPPAFPRSSWWAEPVKGSFYARCQDELTRMKRSKEHDRIGCPMVVGQVDGKKARAL